jgi:hypothetical protein
MDPFSLLIFSILGGTAAVSIYFARQSALKDVSPQVALAAILQHRARQAAAAAAVNAARGAGKLTYTGPTNLPFVRPETAGAAFQPEAPPPDAPPADVPVGQFTGDPIPLVKGRGYYAVVDVSDGIKAAIFVKTSPPFSPSPDELVMQSAHGEGFSNLYASKKKPPGPIWGALANGDWYISGHFAGEDRMADRVKSTKLGDVVIKDVWIA